MCYLKNLSSEQSLSFDDIFSKGEETTVENSETEANVLIPFVQRHVQPQNYQEQQMLTNLFQMIQKNNSLIRVMHQENSIQTVKQTRQQVEEEILTKREESCFFECSESQDLCGKLFGLQKYKYFLQISEEFPEVIYKERNFNLSIKLVDSNKKIVRNFNILNLCCAVSNSDAEWIHENRAGEPFLKGKTEVELYKGQASFMKLYARDVSRIYPQGKVNLVIYSKPSALLYAGSKSFDMMIQSSEIKPLIIKDLMIKAKRKQ